MFKVIIIVAITIFCVNPGEGLRFRFRNTKKNNLSCIQGGMTIDSESNAIVHDNTKKVTCSPKETKCYLQQYLMKSDDWSGLIKMGGCYDKDYEDFYNPGAKEIERYSPEGIQILDYTFKTCDEPSDCSQFFPQESESVITCKTGLTVTSAVTGEVEFEHHYSEKCKVHASCEVVTVFQYHYKTWTSRKYKYSGCGDPYNTRHEGLNVLPFVPASPSEDARQYQCMGYGCVESFFGLCLCPRELDLSEHVVMWGTSKKMCDTDMCN